MATDNFANLDQTQGAAGPELTNPEFDKAGQNVVRAIKDADQALAIALKMERDDKKRDNRRATVLAAYNGAAPYSDDDLKSEGQSWAFNLSFGFMEGVVGRALAPYIRFGCDVNRMADIEGKLPEEKMEIIREEFVETVKTWGRWLKTYTRWILELVLNGWSTIAFPDEFDPFPVFIPQRDGWVPEASGNDVKDADVYVWRKAYLIHDLFKHISDEAAATTAGWNVPNVRKAIEKAKPHVIANRDGQVNWEELEKSVRDGALSTSILGNKEIKTFHVVCPELDGSVTYWIVARTSSSGEKELFRKDHKFDSMSEFLVYADLEPGDGQWYGSKGIGQRAFNTHRSIDKLRCEALNQTFLGGLAVIQAQDTAAADKLQLAVIGRFLSIPPEVQILPGKLPVLPETYMQVDAMLQNTAEERIGDVVPGAQSEMGGDKTATQSRIDAGRAMQITEANLLRFVDPFGKVLSLMVRRLCKYPTGNKEALDFQARCVARGLTPEDFAAISGAKAFGQVSQVVGKQDQGIMSALQTFRGDPDINQRELKNKALQVMVGDDLSKDLLVSQDDQANQLEQGRQQNQEIASMKDGLPMPVSPRDDHLVHLTAAISWLGQMIAQAKQMQPTVNLKTLDSVHQHAEGHLEGLKQNKAMAQQYAQGHAQMAQIAKALDGIQKASEHAATILARTNGGAGALPSAAGTPAGGHPPSLHPVR